MTSSPSADDTARIDLNDADTLNHWTDRLGVSREVLARVIAITGDRAADVADYLRNEGTPAANDG